MSFSAAHVLREQNLSVTAQRLAILNAVAGAPHSTADAIFGVVREELGAISRQSVYDTVNTLADRGVIRRIQPMGSSARYETRVADNHHHLICRSCNSVTDIDCAVGERPCLTACDNYEHGYVIDEAEVIYWGICPSCQ